MKHWNVVLGITSNEILEHDVDKTISTVSPVTSGDRKRRLSAGTHGYDDNPKRRMSDVRSPMTLPASLTDAVFPSHRPAMYLYLQEGDAGRKIDEGNPPMLSHVHPPTKRNRFNLSRYQLGDDEDGFDLNGDQSANPEDVKPNKFKTQMERLMQPSAVESEESGSTDVPEYEVTCPSQEGEENSSSSDSMMSPRVRLRQFRDEHSHHVVIPKQWEGENNLHKFVAFGTVEDALRPLGLMVARAALVNDAVTTRLHRHL